MVKVGAIVVMRGRGEKDSVVSIYVRTVWYPLVRSMICDSSSAEVKGLHSLRVKERKDNGRRVEN